MTHIPHGRILASAAGAAFTVGGLVILMGSALLNPVGWSQYHVLTILTVFGVIASGHLMATAARAKHFFAALGFGVLFIAGTMLVVGNSVGRQAEVIDANTLSAEATNAALAGKHSELSTALERLAEAEKMVSLETKDRGCGRSCKDWKQRAVEVRSHISVVEAEIAALGPQKPVNVKAERMAEVAALFGADKAKAKAALMLLEPFLWCLFFEIGSIVSLGFAFRSSAPVKVADSVSVSDSFQTSFPALDTDSAKVLAALHAAGKPLCNDDLAKAMQVQKSEASKRANAARSAGAIQSFRDGKFVYHAPCF